MELCSPCSPKAKLDLYELKDVLVRLQLKYSLSIKMERVKDKVIHICGKVVRKRMRMEGKANVSEGPSRAVQSHHL